jgi:cytochrome P450
MIAPRTAGLPLVGLVPHLLRDPLATITAAAHRHGDISLLRIGPMDSYLLAHPDPAQEVLGDKSRVFTKESSLWEAAQSFVGKGIGTTDGEGWLEQRRAMQPQFHISRLGDLLTMTADAVREQVDDLRWRAGEPLSLFREVRKMTTRVFLRTMFGTSINNRELDIMLGAIRDSFEAVDKLLWTSFLPGWVPVPGMRRYRKAIAAFDTIVYRIIRERLDHPVDRDDLLNLILKSFAAQEDGDAWMTMIRDQVATMIVATQDGPSLMMGWTLTLLCQHPAIEATLREELEKVLGGGGISVDGVPSLEYTRAVLLEGLRLYPPLWLTVRKAIEDEMIGDYNVPRGTFVFLSAYHIQRHPQFWPSPDVFDPSRFLKNGSAPSHRGAFLPFGLGPHLCIGKHYGLAFGQMLLAEILQRFRVRLAPGTKVRPKGMVTIQPRDEVYARFDAIKR